MGSPSRHALLEQHNMNLNIGIPEPQAEDAHSDTSGFSNAEWARHHIEQLATADSEAEYDRRAESALARHTNIAVNGSQVSKANYRSQWGAAFSAVGEVRIHCAIETPQLSIHMCQNPVIVGLTYDAVFSSPPSADFDSRSPLAHILPLTVSSTMNMTIANDKTLPADVVDRRRIVAINQVLVDQEGYLTFPLRTSF